MSESFCEVSLGDSDDGEACEFYAERIVTARKDHRCAECQEPIRVGDQHHVTSGKYDGEFFSDRFCEACWEIAAEFSEDGSRMFGVVWSTFRDEWARGANLQGCLNRLSSVAAKALMTRQWRKWKGLDKPPAAAPETP